MEVTAVVLHKGALAYYVVEKDNEKRYRAHLIRYGGEVLNKPPKHMHFTEEGRHCTGDTNKQDLMDDLCYTVKRQLENKSPDSWDKPISG